MNLAGRVRAWVRGESNPGVVLLYHRVAEPERDPFDLAVSPRHFEEHLRMLRERCALVPAADLRTSRIRRRVAITFDDGYADNVLAALPRLRAADAPATFFILSGAVGGEGEFWWDALEALLLGPQPLPGELRLVSAGRRRHWRLDGADPAVRERIFREVHAVLQAAEPGEAERLMDELHAWAARERSARPAYRAMTPAELRTVAETPGMEIGSHTVSHPQLSGLDPSRQAQEISGSRRALQELTGRSVARFSYPYGWPVHYSAESVRTVREAGYSEAFTAVPDRVGRRAPPLEIPRVTAKNVSGEDLWSELRNYLE